jgi:hypothetical protein
LRCKPPPAIARLHGKSFRIPLPELVARGALHFGGAARRSLDVESQKQAEQRRVWTRLIEVDPRVVKINGLDRLVINRPPTPDELGAATELLAEAIAFSVAERALSVPLAAFARQNFTSTVRHDYDVQTPRGVVRLEVRGRFRRQGRLEAIDGLDEKFSSTRDFRQGIGILAYPTDSSRRTTADVEILDPEGTGARRSPRDESRALLRHFALSLAGTLPDAAARLGIAADSADAELDVLLEELQHTAFGAFEEGTRFQIGLEPLVRARAAVEKAGLPYVLLDEGGESTGSRVSISTMHLAKGLEFRSVAVLACDDEVIPSQKRIEAVGDDADLEEVYATERHLLYVACTRARDHLLVAGVKPASEFLDDLLAV